MKRVTLLLMLGILLSSLAFAANTDNFDIVVTCSYLDVSLRQSGDHGTDYTQWNLGTMAPGAAAEEMSTASHIWVENGSNTTVDFSAFVESPTPAPCGYGTATAWTPGATAGTDQFVLDLGVGTDSATPSSYTNITATTLPGDDYLTSASAGTGHDLYASLQVPSSTTDGCQHTLTVTIEIAVH
jgi:hypothetical protein